MSEHTGHGYWLCPTGMSHAAHTFTQTPKQPLLPWTCEPSLSASVPDINQSVEAVTEGFIISTPLIFISSVGGIREAVCWHMKGWISTWIIFRLNRSKRLHVQCDAETSLATGPLEKDMARLNEFGGDDAAQKVKSGKINVLGRMINGMTDLNMEMFWVLVAICSYGMEPEDKQIQMRCLTMPINWASPFTLLSGIDNSFFHASETFLGLQFCHFFQNNTRSFLRSEIILMSQCCFFVATWLPKQIQMSINVSIFLPLVRILLTKCKWFFMLYSIIHVSCIFNRSCLLSCLLK